MGSTSKKRNILVYPHEILRSPARPVERIDGPLQGLIDEMFEIMYRAQGVGLAANQIGELLELVVMDVSSERDRPRPMVLVNPTIVASEGEVVEPEGCLSIPNYTADVKRAARVQVFGYDREGREVRLECEGLLAKCVQHELDHLRGICFVDRLGPVKKALFQRKWPKLRSQGAGKVPG